MAAIATFSGLGSNIDFSQLTEAILADRSRPISLLQSRSTQLSKRNDAYKLLNTKLATLTTAADALTNRELGNGRNVSSNAADKVAATATASAAVGSFSLSVTRLATSLTQTSRVYASAETAVLAGNATTASFELRLGGATSGTAITIDSNNNSLEGLRDAINGANAGVSAAIVATDVAGTQNKLVLTSNATGTAGRVELVETTATGTLTDLGITSLNPPGATNDFSALDATFTLNGLSVTRSSNTVSDAVSGVTFNLANTGNATITVSSNTNDLEARIRSFVNSYNEVQDVIASQYTKDGSGKYSGVLVGDATLRTIQSQLRSVIGQSLPGTGSTLDNLTQIGIGRDENNRLTFDAAILKARLVETVTTTRSTSSSNASLVGATVTGAAAAGTITVNTTRLATNYVEETASVVSGIGILANPLNPATFQLQKGGVATGPTFTITSANNSLAGLRDAINSANGEAIATIETTGLTEKLVLTSQGTGAANRIQLVEVSSPNTGTGNNLNLTPTSAGGSDYAQLDSEATVNGQTITRSTNTISDHLTGLSLSLLGVGTATVTVTVAQKKTGIEDVRALFSGKTSDDKGLAHAIYDSYKNLSDDVIGIVKNAITGNETSIKNIEKNVGDQLARLSRLRQTLTKQFAAVDAAINQLNGQGTALTNLFDAQKQNQSK